ncbi:MAG: glycosyltransferase [Chloroflexi bacterium]|nr:glycosyltransferase [Chloroflexota bacterium]
MPSTLPKILYLSRSVPPGASGSSVITANLARQFTPGEMVIIGAYFVGSPPVEWQPEWPRLIHATIHPPDGWRGGRWLRWLQWPWLVLLGLWVCLRQQCQVILGTYPDEVYLLAAYVISLLTGRPLLLYFHNTYLEQPRGNIMAGWLQPRVFKRARHMFVMSRAMQDLYRRYYPDLSCTPLVHSFNEPLPNSQALPATDTVQHPLRLALSGSVNASNEGAVAHLAQALAALPDTELWLYSRTNPAYLRQLGIDGPRFRLTTVSRDHLIQELQQADILFLPHGFSDRESVEEIETVFPSRTIEYLISGRPILAHVPEKCYIADFLREHQCALLVTQPEALVEAINRLRSDRGLRRQLVANALRAAHQFHGPVVASHLRNVIQSSEVTLAAKLPL